MTCRIVVKISHSKRLLLLSLPYTHVTCRAWLDTSFQVPIGNSLLSLLGGATRLGTDVPADIGGVGSLADDSLEGAPALLGSGRSALVGKLSVNASSKLANGILDKAALCNASAEKDSVDGEQDPGTLLEEEGGTKDAEPEEDLEKRNKCHGAIIILLDKLANGLRGSRCLWLGARLSSGWGLDSGQQVGSHISSDVENGVDGEGEDGKRDLAREEPCQGHDWESG